MSLQLVTMMWPSWSTKYTFSLKVHLFGSRLNILIFEFLFVIMMAAGAAQMMQRDPGKQDYSFVFFARL